MEGTIAEIRMFAGTFAPRNWAFCQGQILSISQNTALFSLLGTTYGGNGTTTFALPDFQGRTPVGTGSGAGLSSYELGQVGGAENTTLLLNNLPAHNHASVTGSLAMPGHNTAANTEEPANAYPGTNTGISQYYNGNDGSTFSQVNVNLAVQPVGNSMPFTNIQPVIGMNMVICLYGIFPSRN